MHVINTLAPVFVVIALGAALRRTRFLPEAFFRHASRLVYWVALPCLLFYKIAGAPQIDAAAGGVFLIALIGMAGSIAVAVVFAAAVRMPAPQVGAFVQAGFRGNLAYVGLAVILYAFSAPGAGDAGRRAQTAAVLALGPLVPIYNVAAVVALLAGGRRLDRAALRKMAVQIATNPLLLASVAGLAVSLSPFRLPPAARRTCEVVGQFALPLALLVVGGALASTRMHGRVTYCVVAAAIKVGVSPAVGYAAAVLLGLGPQETAVGLILLACPTAVASYVLAEQLEGDAALSAGVIVASTLLSIISLSVVVAAI